MSDYIEYDGTEKNLENILIWWGTREPYVHADNCNGDGLHCCYVTPKHNKGYFLQSSIGGMATSWPRIIPIAFGTPEGVTDMEPGDRIYYLGGGDFELVKNEETVQE